MSNKITKLNPLTCPLTIAHIRSLPSPKGFCVFKGHAYEVENTGNVASVFQIGYGGQQFENQWTDADFGFGKPNPMSTEKDWMKEACKEANIPFVEVKPNPMTTKSTPGPWRHNPNDAEIWPTTGRRAPIATVFTAAKPDSEMSDVSGSFTEEESANAQLIASAPALLAALKGLLAAAKWQGGVTYKIKGAEPQMEAARQAISQAENAQSRKG